MTTNSSTPTSSASPEKFHELRMSHTTLRCREAMSTLPIGDQLARTGFARAIAASAAAAQGGTVISVEGAWGCGKTHVLATVAKELAEGRENRRGTEWGQGLYWLNPWLMADPDLLARLCELLLADLDLQIPDDASDPARAAIVPKNARDFAKRLLPGLIQFLMVGSGVSMIMAGGAALPLGVLLQSLSPAIVSILERVTHPGPDETSATATDANRSQAEPPAVEDTVRTLRDELKGDPVEQMLSALQELVHQVRNASVREPSALKADPTDNPITAPSTSPDVPESKPVPPASEKLFVFIDDLDRCLPEVQVRILQSLYFLTQSGAELVFLVGMDPALLETSLRAHYRSDVLDGDAYLRKLVHLRCRVPNVRRGGNLHLVAHLRNESLPEIDWPDNDPALGDLLSKLGHDSDPDMANPRTLRRVFDRMTLHRRALIASKAEDDNADHVLKNYFPQFFVCHLVWETQPDLGSYWLRSNIHTVQSRDYPADKKFLSMYKLPARPHGQSEHNFSPESELEAAYWDRARGRLLESIQLKRPNRLVEARLSSPRSQIALQVLATALLLGASESFEPLGWHLVEGDVYSSYSSVLHVPDWLKKTLDTG